MIVLDTHVLIWLMQDDPKLGAEARRTIDAAALAGQVLIPAICTWEIALLIQRGKVRLPVDVVRWMGNAVNGTGLRLAPLSPEIAVDSVQMAWDHRDPADRMIVATARHWSATLATVDRAIHEYAQHGHIDLLDARR